MRHNIYTFLTLFPPAYGASPTLILNSSDRKQPASFALRCTIKQAEGKIHANAIGAGKSCHLSPLLVKNPSYTVSGRVSECLECLMTDRTSKATIPAG